MIPGNVNNSASSGAAGSGVQKTVFITSTGSFTIPSDFASLVSIEAIGAGANGAASTYSPIFGGSNGAGGGGGAYAKITSLSGLTAGGTLYCQVPAANSGDAWANITTNAAPTSTSDGVLAKGASGSSRGASSTSVGTTKRDGGNAGNGGGGGGAGGPNGDGGNGGGSLSGAGGVGNNGASGGGSGGSYPGGAGGNGSYWIQTSNSATAGPGGGGGSGMPGGAGGNYGGGGGGGRYSGSTTASSGAGKPGLIVFTYLTT